MKPPRPHAAARRGWLRVRQDEIARLAGDKRNAMTKPIYRHELLTAQRALHQLYGAEGGRLAVPFSTKLSECVSDHMG